MQTIEGDSKHYIPFQLGTPSLPAAGYSMAPLVLNPRFFVALCVLHWNMAMGWLLAGFLDWEASSIDPSYHRRAPNWVEFIGITVFNQFFGTMAGDCRPSYT